MISETFNNERGVSLTYVVIAAGIMGFLAVVMMKMQDNQVKAQNDMVARTEILGFMSKLNGYLSRSDYCEKTFAEKEISPGGQLTLDQIINPLGRVIYQTGEKYGNNAFTLDSISQHDFYYDHEENLRGVLTLRVTMGKNKNTVGARKIVKDLQVDLLFDENNEVIGCGNVGALGSTAADLKEPAINLEGIVKALNSGATLDEADYEEKMQEAIQNNPSIRILNESLESVRRANDSFVKE